MTKPELVKAIAEKTEMTQKDAANLLNTTIDVITEELVKGGEVNIVGFGKFSIKTRAAREGRNPSTGEKIQIPETKAPAFKFGKALKEAIKNA